MRFTIYDLRFTKRFAILVAFLSVLLVPSARAATIISGTLSITNHSALTNATSGQSYTLNGSTRTFTNSVADAATQILVRTNDSASTIALSLVSQAGAYPFTGQKSLTLATATNITFTMASGTNLAITLSPTNWGTVTYTTQTVGTAQTIVRVPVSAESSTTQTNVATQLWQAMESLSQVRALTQTGSTINSSTVSNTTAQGSFLFAGGLGLHGATKTNNYTLTTNDLYVGTDTTSNTNLVLTLPSAASATNLLYLIKDEANVAATNTIKIYPASGDLIDGLTNLVVSNNFGGVILRSRGGTNWAVIGAGGGVSGSSGGGSGGAALTNTVWVASDGSDSTGARGNIGTPFLTLGAAKTASASGDTIFVLPGTYDAGSLLKDGVNWHFFDGAKILYTGSDPAIFDASSGGTFVCSITGDGEFETTQNNVNIVAVRDSGSTVRVRCKSMTIGAGDSAAVFLGTGSLIVEGCDITSPGRPPVLVTSTGTLRLTQARVTNSAGTYHNGAAVDIVGASTNVYLRDCVLFGNTGASSPVSVRGGTVKIEGSLTANLPISATVVRSEKSYVGGILNSEIDTTDFALDTNYTNGTHNAWVSCSLLLSSDAVDTAQVALYLDQDADTTFEQTGITASVFGLATNTISLSAFLQPGAIFSFANLTTGAGGSAAVVAGSSQWVKQ
jgi:hypothetical protein